MREIKFQAWDEELKIMYSGDEIESRDDLQAYLSYGELVIFRITDGEYTQLTNLQYTGLPDKNGREIYDGYIIDGSWVNPMSQEKVIRHYKVTFDKGKYNAELIGHHPYGSTMLYFENEKAEVIGNIYENPELLEV